MHINKICGNSYVGAQWQGHFLFVELSLKFKIEALNLPCFSFRNNWLFVYNPEDIFTLKTPSSCF